ncbi:Alpha-D-GlcNAc alpha-1,2-L-rhamnosyl transferase [Streptococcus sp. HSISM1]|nr:Alpha-D-GlcNAc alpha-1,2-L-rhamnosyl transferase [Streptococcus sp. HSISM1]
MTQSIYIVGSKGIPAKYGGFETFVEKLTEFQQDKNIQYYVACMRENSAKSGITADTFEHNGAICYNIDVPNIGPARAIAYDIAALNKAIEIAKENKDQAPIFYVLACRIGPFISKIKRKSRRSVGPSWSIQMVMNGFARNGVSQSVSTGSFLNNSWLNMPTC